LQSIITRPGSYFTLERKYSKLWLRGCGILDQIRCPDSTV